MQSIPHMSVPCLHCACHAGTSASGRACWGPFIARPAPGWILSCLLQQAHAGEAARASTEASDNPTQVMWVQETKFFLSLTASWSCWDSLGRKSEWLPAVFKKEYSPSTYCRLLHRRRHEKSNVLFLNRSVPCLPTASHAGRWEEEQARTSSTAGALSWEREVWGCQLGTAPCGNVVPLAKMQLKKSQTSVPSLCERKWKRTNYFSFPWDL